ncbi:unnamed protein product, partial [Musa acuminata subsp. burmannicoides]
FLCKRKESANGERGGFASVTSFVLFIHSCCASCVCVVALCKVRCMVYNVMAFICMHCVGNDHEFHVYVGPRGRVCI